ECIIHSCYVSYERIHLLSQHFPYTTLFRSIGAKGFACRQAIAANLGDGAGVEIGGVQHRAECRLAEGRFRCVSAIGRLRTFQLRSEEHTSELQSQSNIVCRLLLEIKNNSYI